MNLWIRYFTDSLGPPLPLWFCLDTYPVPSYHLSLKCVLWTRSHHLRKTFCLLFTSIHVLLPLLHNSIQKECVLSGMDLWYEQQHFHRGRMPYGFCQKWALWLSTQLLKYQWNRPLFFMHYTFSGVPLRSRKQMETPCTVTCEIVIFLGLPVLI